MVYYSGPPAPPAVILPLPTVTHSVPKTAPQWFAIVQKTRKLWTSLRTISLTVRDERSGVFYSNSWPTEHTAVLATLAYRVARHLILTGTILPRTTLPYKLRASDPRAWSATIALSSIKIV